ERLDAEPALEVAGVHGALRAELVPHRERVPDAADAGRGIELRERIVGIVVDLGRGVAHLLRSWPSAGPRGPGPSASHMARRLMTHSSGLSFGRHPGRLNPRDPTGNRGYRRPGAWHPRRRWRDHYGLPTHRPVHRRP